MVDLAYGRGITDIVREIPLYFGIFEKIVGIKLFHRKPAMYGSVDVNNICIVVIVIGGLIEKMKIKT
jgi:Fe-coproporphyrin III synthase